MHSFISEVTCWQLLASLITVQGSTVCFVFWLSDCKVLSVHGVGLKDIQHSEENKTFSWKLSIYLL